VVPAALAALVAPVGNQGRLDFEQHYRENATFAWKTFPIVDKI